MDLNTQESDAIIKYVNSLADTIRANKYGARFYSVDEIELWLRRCVADLERKRNAQS